MQLETSELTRSSAQAHLAERTALAAVRVAEQTDATDRSLDELERVLVTSEAVWLQESDRTDEVKARRESREVTADDHKIWGEASAAYFTALEAICSYRPRTASELVHKARLLTSNHRANEEDFAKIYLADAEALAAGSSPECLASSAAHSFAEELRCYERWEISDELAQLQDTWRRMEGHKRVAGLGWAGSPAGLAFRLLAIADAADRLQDPGNDGETAEAVKSIRDTIANVLGELKLPFDPVVAEYFLGEEAMGALR